VNDGRCYSCGRANPGLWGFGPAIRAFGSDFGFVPAVIGIASAIFLVMILMSGGAMGGGGLLSLLAPSTRVSVLFGVSGAVPVFRDGAWWTVLSAIWLHGGIIHLVFNMMALRNIGPASSDIIGPWRTVIVYVVAGACGFVLTSVVWYTTVVVLGIGQVPILGALLHYGRASGSRMIRSQMTQYVTSILVMGLLLPYVDNVAHLGGLAGGYLTSMWMNPLTPERGNHMIVALGLLAASLLAVLASVVTGLAA
jgi:rhomboid protease GluP